MQDKSKDEITKSMSIEDVLPSNDVLSESNIDPALSSVPSSYNEPAGQISMGDEIDIGERMAKLAFPDDPHENDDDPCVYQVFAPVSAPHSSYSELHRKLVNGKFGKFEGVFAILDVSHTEDPDALMGFIRANEIPRGIIETPDVTDKAIKQRKIDDETR